MSKMATILVSTVLLYLLIGFYRVFKFKFMSAEDSHYSF